MPKRTSAANPIPIRVVIVTLDSHLAGAVDRAARTLRAELPELTLTSHAAADWAGDDKSLARCKDDIGKADIILTTMLFMEEHIKPVLPSLQARREQCDALVACVSASEVVRLTRMGGFSMDSRQGGALAFLKKLRGTNKHNGSTGAKQMAMLRQIPKILRLVPGTAQDVRAYFLTLQYWLAGSDENVANMVRLLITRYADGPRRALRGTIKAKPPAEYPDVGVYHPRLKDRITDASRRLPAPKGGGRATVGLLIMRSHVLAGDTRHYDGVIEEFEARGLRVIPAFASGLDARPAIESFFVDNNQACVDAVVSLTGFSLVGGPAYNDTDAAQKALAQLGVPYVAVQSVGFQSLEQWEESERGLLPIEATMMVAIPELDGATGPMVFGGRSTAEDERGLNMHCHQERAAKLVERVDRMITLRQTERAERKLAVVLFNFPPNSGSTGTAAHLSVFSSLFNTLNGLKQAGYSVDVPESVDALREQIITGNASQFGADANVHERIAVDDHVRRETWLDDIEAHWGSAPGRQQSDGASIFVLGARFGNVFVGIQPSFGYEGDPMRLLFESGFAPTHAFSCFYRYLREDFGAHAVLHFGTHGALEFMPGKQVGLSESCWPDRLIGDLPNYYLYAANNPSEAAIAKRRSAATVVSYLTPPITQAGLYNDLVDLDAIIARWRGLPPEETGERDKLVEVIAAQALKLDLIDQETAWPDDAEQDIAHLADDLASLEETLIPQGLHTVGEGVSAEDRIDLLQAVGEASHKTRIERPVAEALVNGQTPEQALAAGGHGRDDEMLTALRDLAETDALLARDHEIPALVNALDGNFVPPTPGGDLLRTPAILPTGRNIHGFDPFRLPNALAVADGADQAQRLLDRHISETGTLPESIAMVLWGTDNLKGGGGPIAQALALIGARPRFDSYGRLAGAELMPLSELGRPRVDVVVTLSGIFRDLLPLQTRMLAEASYLAAMADEPLDQNFVRKHTLETQEQQGCDLETAALRVFSNADGAYGSNVNHMIDCGAWNDEDELADVYTRRKCFAFDRTGKSACQEDLLVSLLGDVELTYQNLDSVELGVTTIDHYFDTLGGISRAVTRAKGRTAPVYVGDETSGHGVVRTMNEQVALETRTRMLNPKWYEGMLEHGYEGVRQIEAHVTNTVGWSATTTQVDPWVYQQLTQTYVLDQTMRNRLAELNPKASVNVANRLLEAHERQYWTPDSDTLDALRQAGEELEDRLEGVFEGAAA